MLRSLAAVVMTLLLMGCGDSSTAPSYPTGPSDTVFQGLRLELDVEPEVVAAGDTVDVTVRITSVTDSVVILATPTTCMFRPDVFLRRGGKWDRSHPATGIRT